MKADELAVRIGGLVDQVRRDMAKMAAPLFSLVTSTPDEVDNPVGPKFSELMFGNILETGEKCWQEKYLLEARAVLVNPLVADRKARLIALVHFWRRSLVVQGQQRKVTGRLPLIEVMESEVRAAAMMNVADYVESLLEKLDDDE